MTDTALRQHAAPEVPTVQEVHIVPDGPAGNPGAIGLPAFLVGAFALSLYLIGFTPATGLGISIPLIMTATGVGLVIAAVWSARLNQNAVASVYGIFSGFWLSYAALVLGLIHGWFGIVPEDVVRSQQVFISTWLVIIALLTVSTLRLPAAFTLLFALVELALALLLLGVSKSNETLTHASGYAALAFFVVGAYLYVGTMLSETGGKPLPLGSPLVN